MSDTVIKAEHLSKKYIINHQKGGGYVALRDVITAGAKNLAKKIASPFLVSGATATEEFFALKDVSFEIKQGDRVGIIGRNGAGKSTLLKILSRITEPTIGRVEITGQVASLLEVGTGFHPELTGRENIYLNGAILGMGRKEIKRKFDEIVDFSEVEKFLDTPVKHYSSGMYVRLAFSVAAHLEPEILIVDEVLAVGDAQFQKKCLGKMGEVGKEGRTVLFVSHNMAAVQSLCDRAYLLDHGQVACSGPTGDVITTYMQGIAETSEIPLTDRADRKGDGRVRLTSISIDSGSDGSPVRCSDSMRIKIGYKAEHGLSGVSVLIGIYDQFSRPLFFLDTRTVGWSPESLPPVGVITCITSAVNITPGPCNVNVAVSLGAVLADHIKHACPLEIAPDDFYGTGKLPDRQLALCLLRQNWQAAALCDVKDSKLEENKK